MLLGVAVVGEGRCVVFIVGVAAIDLIGVGGGGDSSGSSSAGCSSSCGGGSVSANNNNNNNNNNNKEKIGSCTRKTLDRFTTKDSYTWNITHNTESTAV